MMEKIYIEKPIVVEGKYDKIKLSNIFDAVIIVINGYGIYKDKEKVALIKKYAEKDGIILLTDSDGAGFQIRNYLKGIIPNKRIINVYIPQVKGKEKRKKSPSKSGLLGVEGINRETIINAFRKAGVIDLKSAEKDKKEFFTKAVLMDDGLIGMDNSSLLRKKLMQELGLPELLSTKALIEALNSFCSIEGYKEILAKIKGR